MSIWIMLAIVIVLAVLGLSWKNPLYFLFFQVFGRFVLDSFPQYTYVVAAGGLSVMQIYTIAVVVFMIVYLTLRRAWTFNGLTVPIFLMVLVLALSAAYNARPIGFAELGTKWIYLWLLAEFTLHTLKRNSVKNVVFVLLLCFIYPLLNQIVFLVIGAPKVENGVVSYLGSFDHESSLAFLLLGLVAISQTTLHLSENMITKMFLLSVSALSVVGIYLNNYRTALPVLLVFFAIYYFKGRTSIRVPQRTVLDGSIVLFALIGMAFLGPALAERLGDIWYVATHFSELVDFSGNAERSSLLSGRVYLFNSYMYFFMNAGFGSQVLGLGPRAGNELIGVYAHNEYISTLVEYGVVGVLAFLYFLIVAFRFLHRSTRADRHLVPVFAMFVGMLVMSLATMPFHDSRGLILMGIFVALGAFALQKPEVRRNRKRAQFVDSGGSQQDVAAA